MDNRTAVKVAIEMFHRIEDVDELGMVLAMVGTLLDTWLSVYGFSAEDADKAYESLYKAAKAKHTAVGV